MRNDANFLAHGPRGRKGNFFPSSLRTISNYLRSVSANASSIAASTVGQAAVSATSNGTLNEDDHQREQVQWANFDKLELVTGEIRQVLLLTYLNGFQVWDVEEASNVHEIVSLRDGPAAFLCLQPQPIVQESRDGGEFKGVRPLLLVITGDTGSGNPSPGGFSGGYVGGSAGSPLGVGGSTLVPTVVCFYSLQNHSYVHVLRFRTAILAVRCSPRVIAVALVSQIYCFDAGTLLNVFSVLTYPSPAPVPGTSHAGYGAMALGPRWLAYAANQPLTTTTGRISPQHLTPSPGVSPSTSPANGSLVAHYAKESSKHLVAGVMTLGDMGYKKISRYCSELLPDGGTTSPSTGSPSWKSGVNGHTAWQGGASLEPEYSGTVIVRDFVSKTIVAQFRAHSSPLSALAFDPTGTLLVTASVHGHNLNVFRLTPPSATGANTAGWDVNTSYAHLYKLYRGVTNAVIQDISFSGDSQWIAVSSSRGTNHLFAISPFGGVVGPHTHGTVPADGLIGPTLIPAPAFPWWSSTAPVRVNQQPLHPPPPAINLNAVSRIKNGNSGWRQTVTSAAVAAAGRPNALAGAVAAVFHAGGRVGVDSEIETGSLKDQLWILCPTGHLLRYVLHPTAGDEGGYSNGSAQTASVGAPGSTGLSQDLKVIVEPLERWDVCRRPNWVEREERIESEVAFHEEVGYAGDAKSAGMLNLGGSPWMLGKEAMTIEEMHRWFMSNAEVQMHQARPLPIWAKAKIHFHVMLLGVHKEAKDDDGLHGDGIGEIEIERIPTHVVAVHRKDLVPAIERLQKFTEVHKTPGFSVTSTHSLSLEAPSASYFPGAHQGLHPPSVGRPGSSQGRLSSPKGGTAEFFQGSFGSHGGNSEGAGISSGSLPLYISMPHQRDVGMLSGYVKPDPIAWYVNPGRSTNRVSDVSQDTLKDLKRNGSGPVSSEVSIDGQLNHAVTQNPAPIGDAESMVVTNQEFCDVRLQGTEVIKQWSPGAERNIKSLWEMRSTAKVSGVQSVEDGALSLALQSGCSSASKPNTDSEFESEFLYNHDGHPVVVVL
ncbi:unnamed protein product [Sphagnum jensenii]|uniref:BCAS3 domain-containing protein n=1 Tax=Sphagnum jensenii TaxID=128206 RepID=A0ABP1BJM6_9BRYO